MLALAEARVVARGARVEVEAVQERAGWAVERDVRDGTSARVPRGVAEERGQCESIRISCIQRDYSGDGWAGVPRVVTGTPPFTAFRLLRVCSLPNGRAGRGAVCSVWIDEKGVASGGRANNAKEQYQ